MQLMGLNLLRNIDKVLHKVATYQTQFELFFSSITRAGVLAPYHRDINKHGTNFIRFDFVRTPFLIIPQSSSQCCDFPAILIVASKYLMLNLYQQAGQSRFSPIFWNGAKSFTRKKIRISLLLESELNPRTQT